MTPLTNAVLGIAFVVVGAAATILMYYLRGYPHRARKKSAPRAD